MKPQQTVPVIASLAPAFAAAPPLLIVAAIGLGLLWLLSDRDEAETKTAETESSPPEKNAISAPEAGRVSTSIHSTTGKKVTREDLAEALAYGERGLTRKEAVAALEALGFRKTSAYKALSPEGKFASMIEFTPDGLIQWNG